MNLSTFENPAALVLEPIRSDKLIFRLINTKIAWFSFTFWVMLHTDSNISIIYVYLLIDTILKHMY